MISWDCKADDTKENFASILIESLVLFHGQGKQQMSYVFVQQWKMGMEADSEGGTIYLKLTPLLKSRAVRGETGQSPEPEEK